MAINIIIPEPNPKQAEFFKAKTRFVAYGGARGGGKSWALRRKALLLGCRYNGIRMLLIRRSFPELRENHIYPLISELAGIASYKETEKAFTFINGSRLVLGYCLSEADVEQYQGQEYDIIFIDEATHFVERIFTVLKACLRGPNKFPKRIYLTCNPGGVGHAWVKRLFVERNFKETENPDDFTFIRAKVYDNKALLDNDHGYVSMLEGLPEGLREAWLEGSWDVMAGQYFTEFDRSVHVCQARTIPAHWRKYITMDYGLDMLAAYLVGIDENNYAHVMREVYEGRDLGEGMQGLVISAAAGKIKGLADDHTIQAYLAPPDLWNNRQETGKSVANIFWDDYGIPLTKTSNDRINGWMAVKEWLNPIEDEFGIRTSRLKIWETCPNLIRTIPLLQHDAKKVNDVAIDPHEITHAPDALRGFCVYWSIPAKVTTAATAEWTPDMWEDFNVASQLDKQYLLQKWGSPKNRY